MDGTQIVIMVKLLSFDTSTTKTGAAYFEDGKYKESFLITPEDNADKNERFADMCRRVLSTLESYKPDIVVVEKVNVFRNMDATRKLCELIGVVRAWTIINNVFMYEIQPTEWRSQIGIQSKGKKRDDFKRLSIEYANNNVTDKKLTDDEADAICAGVGYIYEFS